MDMFYEEEPGETAEEVGKRQGVIFSRIGRSYNSTIKARDVLSYGSHPGCPGCKYIIGESATKSGPQQRMQDQDYGRDGERREQTSCSQVVCSKLHRWRASDPQIMMKESQAKGGGTPGKHEPRATTSDVHMTDPT